MKEDILEQVVEDWLLSKHAVFVKHNVKFKPSNDDPEYSSLTDSVPSDIDILAVKVDSNGVKHVWAVTCKSWQAGFDPGDWVRALENNPNQKYNGRPRWRSLRELYSAKWARAFVRTIKEETGTDKFTYVLACTKIKGKKDTRELFQNHNPFRESIGGNEIKIMTFDDLYKELIENPSTTLASTQLGRLLQIMQASGVLDKAG